MMLSSLCACNQQLAGGDPSSFCHVEELLIYPRTHNRQKNVKHTRACSLHPAYLLQSLDVQLSQAHTVKSQFSLHSC